jgi:hypothetical protein
MSTTTYLTLRRYVITGTANRPDLEPELNAAASMVQWAAPRCSDPIKRRTWTVPPLQQKGQTHIVDRYNGTCSCTRHRRPARWCAHRLAVEMCCRLFDEPEPKE